MTQRGILAMARDGTNVQNVPAATLLLGDRYCHLCNPGLQWLFEDGAPLARLPFVPINRMRATYATLAQSAGLDATIINAMQGRSEGSAVLYSNYLNPLPQTFRNAALSIAAEAESH